MENLNNGSVVDFDQIQNYQQAAKDFAEGDYQLEQLLLNCFSKGIKTIACCRGHESKKQKPYISFSYFPENEKYLYALMSKLKEKGFAFRYNKLPNQKSYFSVEEQNSFDFKSPSSLFEEINNIINSFDKQKKYYDELPRDLQKYFSIIKKAENDEFLKVDSTSDYFQMSYESARNGYEYAILTNDTYYNMEVEKEGFKKENINDMFFAYTLKVPSHEMAAQTLKEVDNGISGTELNKDEDKQTDKKLNIGFEYDEKTHHNPFINHLKVEFGDTLEIVAKKLSVCRQEGIYAFAIFNGIELNNFDSESPQQIMIKYYNNIKQLRQNNNAQYPEDVNDSHFHL